MGNKQSELYETYKNMKDLMQECCPPFECSEVKKSLKLGQKLNKDKGWV